MVRQMTWPARVRQSVGRPVVMRPRVVIAPVTQTIHHRMAARTCVPAGSLVRCAGAEMEGVSRPQPAAAPVVGRGRRGRRRVAGTGHRERPHHHGQGGLAAALRGVPGGCRDRRRRLVLHHGRQRSGPAEAPTTRSRPDRAPARPPGAARHRAHRVALDRRPVADRRLERRGRRVPLPVDLRLGRTGAPERVPGAGVVLDRPLHDPLRPHRRDWASAGHRWSRAPAVAAAPGSVGCRRGPHLLHLAGARGAGPAGAAARARAPRLHRHHAPGHGPVRAGCMAQPRRDVQRLVRGAGPAGAVRARRRAR